MTIIPLRQVRIRGNLYLVDTWAEVFRNVSNPDDCIPFDEAFVRVRLTTECVVLNDSEHIQGARDDLRKVIQEAHEEGEIESHIDTEPASPELVKSILPELLEELEEHDDNT